MNLFRHLLLWLLLALAGAVLAQWLIQDPGFVLVRYRDTTVEATLVGGALIAALAAATLWVLWRLLGLPVRLWRLRRERDARAGLADGLDALHLGRYALALQRLAHAARDPRVEAPARIAAARASLARGDTAAAAAQLQALPAAHAASRAIAIADTATTEGRHADALVALDSTDAQPLPPRGLALRADALAALGQAAQAYGMLGALRQQQALSPPQLVARERAWAAAALHQAADGNALAESWDALPAALRTWPDVARAYAAHAAALGWDAAAATALERAIDAHWEQALAAAYGALPSAHLDADALQRRSVQAERWRTAHPDDAGAWLGAARLAQARGDGSTAIDLLRGAIARGAGSAAWEALADAYARIGEDHRAGLCWLNALRCARGEDAHVLPGDSPGLPAPAPDAGIAVDATHAPEQSGLTGARD